ncbi:MAG: hypothetical protein K5864_07020 [Bacteroidales bacterium]|nr:hypothetical protein [Bacteroidales bacterium]
MKRIKKTGLALVGIAILMMAFQCGKDYTNPFNIFNIHHSACLSYTDADAKGYESPDSVSVEYQNGTVHVTHHNLLVNCGTAEMEGGIMVTCIREGMTIHIYEEETGNNPADCMCEVDNEFDFYCLERGTFTFVFHNWYPEAQSFTFTF